jgi:hypothetical protein
VHDIWSKSFQSPRYIGVWWNQLEFGIEREWITGQANDGCPGIICWPPGWREYDALVSAHSQVLEETTQGLDNAINFGQEGFGE